MSYFPLTTIITVCLLALPGALHPIVVVYTIVHSSRSTAPGAATFSDFEYSWLQILHLLRESPKITYKVSFRPHCSIVIRVNHDHRLSVPTSAKTPFVQLATDRVEDGVGKKPAARSVSKQAGSSARTKKLADATSRNSHLLPADILHRVLMVKASDCLTLATTTSQQNLQDGIRQWQYVVWPN